MERHQIARITYAMITYFRGDQKRVHHALKVHELASMMGRLEGLDGREQFVLETAAILHDIGIPEAEKKYGSSAGPYQEKEGPPVARDILRDYSLDRYERDRVLFLIGHHHSYGAVDGRDFQILIEADFLVNMHEDDFSAKQADSLGKKIFKTETGRSLLESLSEKLS